jgi:hypothetical protein
MKLQDLHPIDATLVGLNNIYHVFGDNSFYINSDCILTPHKIITKGKQYAIASTSPQGSDAIVHQVKFLDAYFNKGFVYLFVMDLNSERVYIVDLCMECPEDKCTWLLYDIKDFKKLKDYQAVKSYCAKGDDAKKKPLDNCKTNITDNDLLEFDYS